MTRNKQFLNTLFVLTMLLLVGMNGCSQLPFSKPTVTATITSTPKPPKPTRTPTHLPTSTPTATETPTITPTATLPPPLDDFSQARLYSSGPKTGWDFSLTILLPEPVKGEYYARVGDPPKKFTCRPLAEYTHPERLYCSGQQPGVDKNVIFTIIDQKTDQVVFKGFVYLPLP